MKVIVAHPGKQHSFELATALKKRGYLFKYITSVYDKKGSLTNLITKIAKGDLRKKVKSRKCYALEDQDVKQINEIFVVITLFLNKFPKLNKLTERWNKYIESSFYRKVMNYAIKQDIDVIVVYNGYAKKHLEKLNGTKIIKVMDVSIAGRQYLKDILEQEIRETKIEQIKDDHFSYWNKDMIKNDIEGCKNIDYFLVPSEFVRKSLTTYVTTNENIIKVPYGVNIELFKENNNQNLSGPLRIIYVGSVSYRKGIHRLFEAIKSYSDSEVELYLAGSYDENSRLYIDNKDKKNVNFLGFVTRDELTKIYNKSNIFILPSFAEGMAMVGLEALSCGLPLICTYNSGVNDVIIDGINGFVYEANNENELRKKIQWCCNNREKLIKMSREARKTAERYTWDIYHENVVNSLECIIKRGKNDEDIVYS